MLDCLFAMVSRPKLFAAALLAFGLVAMAPQKTELKDGEVLGPETWQLARGLLPEEVLGHYQRGEYINRIADLSVPGYVSIANPPDFQEASRENRGRYGVNPSNAIVDVRTGRQPAYITGLPFPEVDPKDPQAAVKVVWNYFYATWYRGDCHFRTEIVMLGREGVERRVTTDVLMRMLDGAPEARGRSNPDNLLMQTLARVVSPADLNGTVSLTWRYRDPDKHDSLWTFVPGLRRSRQVSALNRSDGFMGSDISMDDGAFFDGKPEDFTFRLLSRQDQLVLMDPYSIRGDSEIVPVAGGGWRIVWKKVPRIGADDPKWKGLPWAPVTAVLVRRPTWIVEAVPKDPQYLYGRVVLRLDAETYLGSWATKYDRAGTLMAAYEVSQGAYYTRDGGKSYVPAGGVAIQLAENFLWDRATVILFPPRNPGNPADYRVTLNPDEFGPDALIRLGR